MNSKKILPISIAAGLSCVLTACGADEPAAAQGQRIFYTGHSFHAFIPPILQNMAEAAGIAGHTNLGLSLIGGSKVWQHWTPPEENNQAKKALRTGKVDVLTVAPQNFMPDDGIDKFAAFALSNNPATRILVQESWLRWDRYINPTVTGFTLASIPKTVDFDAPTAAELWERSAPSFASIDDYVVALNRKLGKQALFVVPVGQAVNALREKILAGKAGQLKKQSELFSDSNAHGTVPLQVLAAYCTFAVVYRRSPVGLPTPDVLAKDRRTKWTDETVRVLQETAWEAAVRHPLSGVQEAGKAGL